MEYKKFAKYYDRFYQNKDYKKEVEFLVCLLKKNDKIIDIGCGTGVHASILEKDGYDIDGLDLNEEMINIAKKRIKGNVYKQNILNIDINKKFDFIISMFAVINHLKSTNELETVLLNLSNILSVNGKVLIDLHNPQSSGSKTDTFDNITRTMKWDYNEETKIEKSEIIFSVNNETYYDSHTFRIFTIDEIMLCCDNTGFKVINVYENYDINKVGNNHSKNLQFLIEKK